MFIGKGVTNIDKAVSRGFDSLAITMNGHGALFETFELFLNLDGTIVFVVSEKRCKPLP